MISIFCFVFSPEFSVFLSFFKIIFYYCSSKNIQEFLDGSKDGVVYFSLGSNLQTHQLPADSLTALVDALGSLKQRILWKHQGDGTQENSSGSNGDKLARAINIKFVKWLPQQAVLGKKYVESFARSRTTFTKPNKNKDTTRLKHPFSRHSFLSYVPRRVLNNHKNDVAGP